MLARAIRDEPRNDAAATAAVQWLERTLDDTANRRLVLPQAFLAIDAVLILCQNVSTGLVVYPRVIAANLEAELPFMATENILMAAVASGGDRQELHELIRQHSLAAAAVVKNEGGKNDLMPRLAADPAFAKVDLSNVLDARKFVGRAGAGGRILCRDHRANQGEIQQAVSGRCGLTGVGWDQRASATQAHQFRYLGVPFFAA